MCIIQTIMSTRFCLSTPIGLVSVSLAGGRVVGIDLNPGSVPETAPADAPSERVRAQLEGYFRDGRAGFSLPLAPAGTAFQQRVWAAMLKIPPGQVRSYGEIARELGSGARAVGNACRRNPIPLIIPCHRVVSAQGIGGYSGATGGHRLEIKRWLLAHEGVQL